MKTINLILALSFCILAGCTVQTENEPIKFDSFEKLNIQPFYDAGCTNDHQSFVEIINEINIENPIVSYRAYHISREDIPSSCNTETMCSTYVGYKNGFVCIDTKDKLIEFIGKIDTEEKAFSYVKLIKFHLSPEYISKKNENNNIVQKKGENYFVTVTVPDPVSFICGMIRHESITYDVTPEGEMNEINRDLVFEEDASNRCE